MPVDPDQLARELRALSDRVSQLESELAQLRDAGQPSLSAAPAAHRSPRVKAQRASLESRIGSQLFNRIGIVALLVGVAWFLKFAIDERWIGPLARVVIGVTGGLSLVGWSEWFRRRGYRAFSYSLKALGTGVLYLSIWAAYTLFGLMPALVALLAMMLVTAGNAWLCWWQNSEVLAFYAAIGGLLTPLLLWKAESSELTLFAYLLLLDLAALALVAIRPWSRLLLAAFAGTAFYAVGWYVEHYTPDAFALTAFFVVAFFLLFSAAPQLLRNLRLASTFVALTFEDRLVLLLLPLLNALLAFAELYALLSEPVNATLRPWVAFAFSFFYLGMLRLARSPRLAGTPTRLPATYLLLSVVACTGAIPLALDGRLIAIGWSGESVALCALALRHHVSLLRVLGGAVLGLAFTGAIALSWGRLAPALVFNPRFGTYLVGVLAGAAVALIASHAGRSAGPVAGRGWQWNGIFASAGATVLLMVAVCLEIAAYWQGQAQIPRADRLIAAQFSYSAWSMLLGALLLAAGFWRKLPTPRWLGLILLAGSIAKVFLFDLRDLSQGYRILSFLALGILLLAVSFVYQRDLLGLRRGE